MYIAGVQYQLAKAEAFSLIVLNTMLFSFCRSKQLLFDGRTFAALPLL